MIKNDCIWSMGVLYITETERPHIRKSESVSHVAFVLGFRVLRCRRAAGRCLPLVSILPQIIIYHTLHPTDGACSCSGLGPGSTVRE